MSHERSSPGPGAVRVAAGGLLLLCLSLPRPLCGEEYWPAERWRTSTAKVQGMRVAPLLELEERIRRGQMGAIESLLVVKNGYLVVERYFGEVDGETPKAVQSITKSVTSILVGIAVGEGKLPGVEAPVAGYLPELQELVAADPRRGRITVGDLLTMRSGLAWDEYHDPKSPLEALHRARDWPRFVLGWPMGDEPGRSFAYNTGGVFLLGVLLERSTGVPVDRYAAERLFAPLGIRGARWRRTPGGRPDAGGGLELRPRDMARIGYLYLRGGRWNGEQLVPEAWVRASVARQVAAAQQVAGRVAGYGYLWWVLPLDGGGDFFAGRGYMGQGLFVVPQRDLVVVVTASARSFQEAMRPIDFLYSHLLPAAAGPATDASP